MLDAFSTAEYTYVAICCLVIDLVSFLSYCFLSCSSLVSGDFVFMQDNARMHHVLLIEPRQQDFLRNVVPVFAVEKTSGSTASVTKQDRDQFSTFSIKRLLTLLITVCFCIMTCKTTFLSISIKGRNIDVEFCIRINKCLFTNICI